MIKLLQDTVTISDLGADKIEVKLTRAECRELYNLLGNYLGEYYINTSLPCPTAVDHRSPENKVNITKL